MRIEETEDLTRLAPVALLAEECLRNAKSAIASISAVYDKCLSAMHSNICVALKKINDGDDLLREASLDEQWFVRFEESLESTVQCVSRIEERVSQLRGAFPKMCKEYIEAEAKLMSLLGHRINLSDISETYKDLMQFKKLSSQLPYIETEDKFHDYANLSRYMNCLEIAKKWNSGFSVWIHDTRHYLDRIRAILKPNNEFTISVESIRSLDALESALYAVRRDSLVDGTVVVDEARRKSLYEPYKVFHKFQHCFSEEFDRIEWRIKSCAIPVRLKWVPSMDSLVLNIYTNAVKYIPKDGKVHRVETKFEIVNRDLAITISSLGPFVPSDEIERIFEDGFRGRNADVASTSGHGKGLAAVKRICMVAGYSVHATSVMVDGCDGNWGVFSIHIYVPNEYMENNVTP